MMLTSALPMMWLCLLAVSADSFNTFYKGSSTQKPNEESSASKPRKLPSHISEFTDPNTGLNPFLDLEEGPTSAGRAVMKDPPFPYFEPMEGDAKERRWNPEEPEDKDSSFNRWTPLRDHTNRGGAPTSEVHGQTSATTTMISRVSDSESTQRSFEEPKQKVEKTATAASSPSSDSIVYASATISVVVLLALLFGVCWWRRKSKRIHRSQIAAESGEMKS